MAVSIGSGFALMKKLPLDERTLFEKVTDMVETQEIFLPDMGYAFVKETGKMYVFNRDNDVIEGLGKWRIFEGGVDAVLTKEIVASTSIGMVSEGSSFAAGTPIEDILIDMLSGKTLEDEDFFYGASDTKDIVSLYQFQDSTVSVCNVVANNQYLIFAAKKSLGEFNVYDSNGWNYNSEFDKIEITHNGVLYNVLVGKNKITAPNGVEFKLTFK